MIWNFWPCLARSDVRNVLYLDDDAKRFPDDLTPETCWTSIPQPGCQRLPFVRHIEEPRLFGRDGIPESSLDLALVWWKPGEKGREAFAAIRSRLRPGGQLLLACEGRGTKRIFSLRRMRRALREAGFGSIRSFLVLPPYNARSILFPLEERRVRHEIFRQLHVVGGRTLRNRLGLLGMKILSGVGALPWACRYTVLAAERPETRSAQEGQAGTLVEEVSRCLRKRNLSFCALPVNRKFLLPISSSQEGVIAYGKLYLGDAAESCGRNEVRILRKLKNVRFETATVPKILYEGLRGRSWLVLMEYKDGLRPYKTITPMHLRWLIELYRSTSRRMWFSESPYREILEEQLREIHKFLGEPRARWLDTLACELIEELSAREMGFCLAQREFPYYHALKIRGENRIFVVDWELGAENYPPYFDLFHCLLSGLPERKRTGLRNSFLERAVALFKGQGSSGEMILRYGRNIDVPADVGYLLFPLYLLDQISIFLKWDRTPERSGLKERLEALRTIATEKAFVRTNWMGGSCEL